MREILWQVPAYRRYFRVEFARTAIPEDQEANVAVTTTTSTGRPNQRPGSRAVRRWQ
jgi:hypothetical protein